MRIEEESDNVGDIVAEAEVNLGFEKPCITEEELDEQEAEETQPEDLIDEAEYIFGREGERGL